MGIILDNLVGASAFSEKLIVGHQQLPLSVLPMFYYHIFIYKQT